MRHEQGAVALCSGSSGNAVLVCDGKRALLCDAGLNGKQFAEALTQIEIDPRQIEGILITHEHTDHISGLGVLQRRYGFKVYATAPTYQTLQRRCGKLDEDLFMAIDAECDFAVGAFQVYPFSLLHDAAAPVGYKITMSGGKSVAICTDLGEVTPLVRQAIYGSDLVFIEANYDEQMLRFGQYPYHLKQRISGQLGHLSNLDCASFIDELIENNTARFVLSHLSQENNYPHLALLTVANQLRQVGKTESKDYIMSVAKRHIASEWQQLG